MHNGLKGSFSVRLILMVLLVSVSRFQMLRLPERVTLYVKPRGANQNVGHEKGLSWTDTRGRKASPPREHPMNSQRRSPSVNSRKSQCKQVSSDERKVGVVLWWLASRGIEFKSDETQPVTSKQICVAVSILPTRFTVTFWRPVEPNKRSYAKWFWNWYEVDCEILACCWTKKNSARPTTWHLLLCDCLVAALLLRLYLFHFLYKILLALSLLHLCSVSARSINRISIFGFERFYLLFRKHLPLKFIAFAFESSSHVYHFFVAGDNGCPSRTGRRSCYSRRFGIRAWNLRHWSGQPISGWKRWLKGLFYSAIGIPKEWIVRYTSFGFLPIHCVKVRVCVGKRS